MHDAELKTVWLTLRCRVGDLGERYATRPLIAEGVRVDVELAARKDFGTFPSTVTKCERPLFNNDEGELVLGAVVPTSQLPFFEMASECALKVSVREVARCDIVTTALRDPRPVGVKKPAT